MIARIRIPKKGKDKCEPQRDAYSDLEDILQQIIILRKVCFF